MFGALLSFIQQVKALCIAIKAKTDTLSPTGSGINSIQQGTVTITNTTIGAQYKQASNTSTITAVVPAKSVVIYQGQTSSTASASSVDTVAAVTLTDATTVTGNCSVFSTGNQPFTVVIYFTVVEYT